VSHRVRLPNRATIAAVIAALAAFIAATAIASEPASARDFLPDPYPVWADCASEGQTCTVGAQTQQVRYGDWLAGGYWGRWTVHTTVTGSIPCTNTAFGFDPFPDQVKRCQHDTSDWIYCTSENRACDVKGLVGEGTYWVKYGASTTGDKYEFGWTMKQFSGNFTCSNSTFGIDPRAGVVKNCWIYPWDY
jgi:hypothetical protein